MALTNLPAADYFTNASRTNIEAKNAQNDILAFIRQSILGGSNEYEVTISSGSITPDGAVLSVDTEGDAISDNLDNITQTNVQDGGFLLIRAENAGRTVVIRHGQGGTGQILTHDSQNIILDDITKFVLLRRDGSDFREVFRTSQGVLRKAMPSIKTDNYTVTIADIGMLLIMNSSSAKAFTLPAINSEIDGAVIMLKNIGTGTLTLTPSGGNTIDISQLQQGNVVIIVADNANGQWRSLTDNISSDAFSQAPTNIKTANYSVVDADAGDFLIMDSGTARTFTLPAISSNNDTKVFMLKNVGSANCTVAKTGADTLEVTTLEQGDAVVLQSDNANKAWRFIALYSKAFPTGLNLASQVKGAMIWFNGTSWVVLAPPSESDQVIVSTLDGAAQIPEWKDPPSGRKEITTSGAGTFTVPLGVSLLFVSLAGAGGGGGCQDGLGGGGGGGGGWCRRIPVRVIPGQTYNYTIGAAGAGHTGSKTGSGANGGQTQFTGEDVTLTGNGGNGANNGSGGNGGSFSSDELGASPDASNQSGGDIPLEVTGSTGSGGDGAGGQGDNQPGGGGGATGFAPGPNGGNTGQVGGDGHFGAGGSGAGEDGQTGGDGGPGLILIEW